MECRGEPADRRSLGGEDEPDAQQPADVAGQMARLGQSLFHGCQHGRELSAELFALRSEADLAARPVEEPDSETGLEDAHGFAHARLGDAHTLGRATKCSSLASSRKIRSSRSSTSCPIDQGF
jgi:hypothetical protein